MLRTLGTSVARVTRAGRTAPSRVGRHSSFFEDVVVKGEGALNPLRAAAFAGQRQFMSTERFKIYTKTGDLGVTSLYTGERRPKDDTEFEVLGATDELSSFIGLARAQLVPDGGSIDLGGQLETIQCTLQDLGSHVATPRDTDKHKKKMARTEFSIERTDVLEAWIDAMDETLPPLTTFILPSGGVAGATLHCCRSICRRAERSIVPLHRAEKIDPAAYKYLNRLSDYFFTAARYAAQQAGVEETIYVNPLAGGK